MTHNEEQQITMLEREIELEFQYYSTLFRECILWITSQQERQIVVQYITKQSSHRYTTDLARRQERNERLFLLCVAMLNNNVEPFLKEFNVENSASIHIPRNFSHYVRMHKDVFEKQLPSISKYRDDNKITFQCPDHGTTHVCPRVNYIDDRDQLLMLHFWHYMALSYNPSIFPSDHRYVQMLWLQILVSMFLCGCTTVKNEAINMIMALAICSSDRILKYPFVMAPIFPIRPLKEMKTYCYEENENDPTSLIAQKVMSEAPDIEEGAFAFISISKDMYTCDIKENEAAKNKGVPDISYDYITPYSTEASMSTHTQGTSTPKETNQSSKLIPERSQTESSLGTDDEFPSNNDGSISEEDTRLSFAHAEESNLEDYEYICRALFNSVIR